MINLVDIYPIRIGLIISRSDQIFMLIKELTPNHIVSHFPPARVLILLNNSEGTTLIDILNVMINVKTFHIAEIQALRWTNSSGTWWTNHSDHCFHEKMMRQLTSSLYSVFMRTYSAEWFIFWPSCLDVWHPGNPSSQPRARASSQASPPLIKHSIVF